MKTYTIKPSNPTRLNLREYQARIAARLNVTPREVSVSAELNDKHEAVNIVITAPNSASKQVVDEEFAKGFTKTEADEVEEEREEKRAAQLIALLERDDVKQALKAAVLTGAQRL